MRRRPRLPVDPPELNLVPLLDMVSLLIQNPNPSRQNFRFVALVLIVVLTSISRLAVVR